MAGGTEEIHELRNKTLELLLDHDILYEGMFLCTFAAPGAFYYPQIPYLKSTIPELP